MSTSAVSDPVKESADRDFIVRQINAAQGRIRSTDVMTAAVTGGILLTAYVLLFTIADHWLVPNGFSPWTRAALLAAVLAGVGLLAWKFLLRPLSKTVTALYAARTLDRESATGGALFSLVDLQQAGAGTSERVRRTIEDRARTHLQATSLDEAVDRTQLIRMGLVLFGLVLVTCLYSVLSPKPISLLRPLTLIDQDVATRTRITNVAPGNVAIPLGGQVEVTADISGVFPESVILLYTTADRQYVNAEFTMEPADENGRYFAVIAGDDVRGIRQLTHYQIQAGDAISESYSITVEVPPTAEFRELHYEYPKYTQLPALTSANPNIDAWEGTTLTLLADTAAPVATAHVELCPDRSFQTDVIQHPATVDASGVTAVFKLEINDTDRPVHFYRIMVQDDHGTRDPSPIVHTVNIQPDAPPVVRLEHPVGDQDVPANATVPLLIHASDPDFLLNSVQLHYEINRQPVEAGERIYDHQDGYQKTWSGIYDFELATLGLKPRDEVRYWIEARDNRHPRGPASTTPSLKLTIISPVSEQQVAENLDAERNRQERMLNQIRKENQDPDDESESEVADQKSEVLEESDPSGDEPETPDGEDASQGEVGSEEPADGTDPSGGGQMPPESLQSTPQEGQDAEDSASEGAGSDDNRTDGSNPSQNEPSKPMDDEDAIERIVRRYLNDSNDASESPADEPNSSDVQPDQQQNEPGQNEPGQNEPGQNEPGQNEPGQNEPGQNEPGQNEPGQNEPGQNEPGQNEPG
ncbi:MAG: hypothetical protein ABGZ35_15715, partial [Planctomycetaceae bacterium]